MSTDWMWCYECPKEAAAEFDRLREDNERMMAALKRLGSTIATHYENKTKPPREELWAMFSWAMHGIGSMTPQENYANDQKTL